MSSKNDMFSQINNAVLDLQASQIQTYERPLKTIARLLQHPSLAEVNRTLVERVKFDAFIAASEKTGVGTMGGHKLAWPGLRTKLKLLA